MEAQYELAFRTLQSGLNLGKVVVRVARSECKASGSQVVTEVRLVLVCLPAVGLLSAAPLT